MSLMDALLLEPHPFEVWIALRADGALGSGTQADPYNGGTRTGPVFPVTAIAKGGVDGREATATVPNHPYVNGDPVVISGATGNANKVYNGRFVIRDVDVSSFKYTMDAAPSASTAPGSLSCTIDPYLFDHWMRKIGANTHVHIGPGEFLTRGWTFTVNDWEIRTGQRITGAGLGVTTLKLVGAYRDVPTFVLAHEIPYLTSFEASDFTIDCNFEGQPAQAGHQWPPICCAAISAGGSNITLRRIRAINWGTHVLDAEGLPIECFVMATAAGHPFFGVGVNCVVEDCIIEKPSKHGLYVCSLISMAGGFEAAGVAAYHRGNVIRNNFVDCEYNDGASSLWIGL